jgi:crossover junction endodeoxyribonuclease RusA
MKSFTLPFPPSSNRYWRHNRGIIHRSSEAVKYIRDAGMAARVAGVTPLVGDVTVMLDFYRPAKRGDLDNSLKVCIDSLRGIAFEDDKQIVRIIAARHEDKVNPRVEVSVFK